MCGAENQATYTSSTSRCLWLMVWFDGHCNPHFAHQSETLAYPTATQGDMGVSAHHPRNRCD
jgi:hypothetical protein